MIRPCLQVNRGNREFQDLVDEMLADLLEQDMDKAGEDARKKAEKEHQACPTVPLQSAHPSLVHLRSIRPLLGVVLRSLPPHRTGSGPW